MNVYARFDEIPSITLKDILKKTKCYEIPSITLKDIKKTKCYGRTVARADGQRENSIPAHKHSLRGV